MTPHRESALAVAAQLAETLRLDQLTPASIAAQCGLTPDEFLAAFPSVDDYLVEVHQQFMARLLETIVADAGALPPSLQRIVRASLVQLDYCLQHRALRNLLAEARRLVPKLAQIFHKRNQTTAMMIAMELKNLGCAQSIDVGRLYCMMVLEAAQIESDAGAAVPEMRQLLADFLALRMPAKP